MKKSPDRAAIAAIAALIAVAFMGSTLVTPLYALYRDAFRFSEITLTLIYAVYVVGNLGALLFFGRLSDQAGRRRVSLPALALAAASAMAFFFASGVGWLFCARLLSGLAVGVASGTGTAWLAPPSAHWYPGASRNTRRNRCGSRSSSMSRCSRLLPSSSAARRRR
jgi:MFS family permease